MQIAGWVRRIKLDQVVEAFVYSLSSRRLDLRSALASYIVGRTLPIHSFHQHHLANFPLCSVCGSGFFGGRRADWNRFSFERHHWGGVWIHDPYYIAFDLEQFAAGDHPTASVTDWSRMRDLLAVIRETSAANPELRPGDLAKQLHTAIPASNESQRRRLITTLSVVGILETRRNPSFRRGWIDFDARPDPPEWKSNWFYPAGFWRGADGIDQSAVDEFFHELSIRPERT